MNALNNLGIVLTVVFSVCLAALVFEILYVLWRRRRFRRRSVRISSADGEFSCGSDSLYNTASKELLYFFCWKNQTTRVEPDSTTIPAASTVVPPVPADGTDALVEEMLKLQGIYGPSRFLFTIKEEEREEMEVTEKDESSTENELVESEKRKTSCSDGCFERVAVANDVVVDIEVNDVTTPFWTPCASPQHDYTPSPSPSRDGNLSGKNSGTENEDSVVLGDSGANTMSFIGIEIPS